MEVLHYTKQTTGGVDDTDFAGHLKISAILRYFQDLATAHAEQLGIGFAAMQGRKQAWVLNRVCAEIAEHPHAEERLTTETYPHKPNAVDAVRDYYLYGEDGRLLVKGTSKWCVLDVETRAIRRVAPLFKFPPEAYTQRQAIADGCMPIEKANTQPVYEAVVRITDLDRNGHVNNARYGDMILNACSKEWLQENTVAGFSLHYMSELRYGNTYTVYGTPNQDGFEGRCGDTEIFRARVSWRKNGV